MNEQTHQIRSAIEKLLRGTLQTYEWDDSISVKRSDALAEALRNIALEVPRFFPSSEKAEYCSERGRDFFRFLLEITK